MDNKIAVDFKNVSKIYTMNSAKKKDITERFYALKDINFSVNKGDIVGILGTNGSGKSTLSKILAGLTDTDSGEITINGEASLIAIRSGLNKQLTGLENIKLKGALLGLPKEVVNKSIEEITEFSELGDFINNPVKTYSSGMKSRLGFAISIHMEPDILIIDEALSVGDTAFNEKCYQKIEELQKKGRTIFFVSHSLTEIKRFCNKGIWIEGGFLQISGNVDEVIEKYTEYTQEYKKKTDNERKAIRNDIYKKRLICEESTPQQKISKKIKYITITSTLITLFIILGLFLAPKL